MIAMYTYVDYENIDLTCQQDTSGSKGRKVDKHSDYSFEGEFDLS